MNPATEEILTAYLDGQLDATQVSALRARLQNEPELAQLLDQLQVQSTQLNLLPRPKARPNFAAQVIAAAERQGAFGGAKPSAIKSNQRNVSWSIQRWAILATSLAALLMIGIFVFLQLYEPKGPEVAASKSTTTPLIVAEKTVPAAIPSAATEGQLPPGLVRKSDEIGVADQRDEMMPNSIGELRTDSPDANSSLRAGMGVGGGGAGMKNEEQVGGVEGGIDPAKPMSQPPNPIVDPAIVAAPPLERAKQADMELGIHDAKEMGESNLVDSIINQVWVVDLPNDETAANEFRRNLESGLTENAEKPGASLPEGQVDVYFVRANENSLIEELARFKSAAVVVLNVNQDLQSQLDTLVNRQQQKELAPGDRLNWGILDQSKIAGRERGGLGEGQLEYLGRQADFSMRLQVISEPMPLQIAAAEGKIGPTLEMASKDKSVKDDINIDAVPRVQSAQAGKKAPDSSRGGEVDRARNDPTGKVAGDNMPSKDAQALAKGHAPGVDTDSEVTKQAPQKPQQSYLILLRRVPQSVPVAPAPTEPIK